MRISPKYVFTTERRRNVGAHPLNLRGRWARPGPLVGGTRAPCWLPSWPSPPWRRGDAAKARRRRLGRAGCRPPEYAADHRGVGVGRTAPLRRLRRYRPRERGAPVRCHGSMSRELAGGGWRRCRGDGAPKRKPLGPGGRGDQEESSIPFNRRMALEIGCGDPRIRGHDFGQLRRDGAPLGTNWAGRSRGGRGDALPAR